MSDAEQPTTAKPSASPLIKGMDALQGSLVFFITIGSVWAFAGNIPPAAQALNFTGIAAGLLCFVRWFFEKGRVRPVAFPTIVGFIIGLLVWCQVAAMNTQRVPFLPSSVDTSATWAALLRLAGLSGGFLALWDWLLGPSECGSPEITRKRAVQLLWAVALNSVAAGAVGWAHRLSGDTRLLWFYQPDISGVYYSFGAFDYRGNASQFFNIAWPAAGGLWWMVWRRKGFWNPLTLLALGAAMWLAICPTLTSSRAGMILSILGVAGLAIRLTLLSGRFTRRMIAPSVLLVAVVIGAGIHLAGPMIAWRWKTAMQGGSKLAGMEGRLAQNANSLRIIKTWPVFGAGPGAYASAHRHLNLPNPFRMGRPPDPKEVNALNAMAVMPHNDFLQALAEWGPLGAAAIAWLFLKVLGLTRKADFPQQALRLGLLLTLLHGTMDYPLQVWGVQWIFLGALLLQRVEWLAPESP